MVINSMLPSYQYQPYNYQQNFDSKSESPNTVINSSVSSDKIQSDGICETCKERKYQDISDDPSVSFKTSGHIDSKNSASIVKSHEMEHVRNENASAKSKGKELVNQTVALHTSVCPECGTTYVSGGTTTTTTKSEIDSPFNLDKSSLIGNNIDAIV